eukprot:7383879-Prymnesium_polylepis.1
MACPLTTKRYHVYCSHNNPGALELLQEFADNQGLTLKLAPSMLPPSRRRSRARFDRRKRTDVQNMTLCVTRDIEELSECDFMLVYLTAQTWTRADANSMFGLEVGRAMDAKTFHCCLRTR